MRHFRWLAFHTAIGVLLTACILAVLLLVPEEYKRPSGWWHSKALGRDWTKRKGRACWTEVIVFFKEHTGESGVVPRRELPYWAHRLIFMERELLPGEIDDPGACWAYATGFPFPALGYVNVLRVGGYSRIVGGLVVQVPERTAERVIPYTVLPTGMIANVALAAMFSATTSGVLRAARGSRRRRRRRCPSCGYSRAGLAGDAACPECGAIDKKSKPPPSAAATSAGEGGGAGV